MTVPIWVLGVIALVMFLGKKVIACVAVIYMEASEVTRQASENARAERKQEREKRDAQRRAEHERALYERVISVQDV